nr:coronin-2B isoform X2 [Danio rerio]|eukprot:XP_017209757.2 coronin-2B isoform X2 [Danio rerio]
MLGFTFICSEAQDQAGIFRGEQTIFTTKLTMSWSSAYRSSKFRHVYGKAGSREQCYEGIPITHSVHDNQFCAVNPKFLAVVTESAGGGAFIVIPLHKPGRVDPHYPRVCGHQGSVMDIKWSPFMDNIIASSSEDCTVRIWQIPDNGLRRNLTEALMILIGHSRRVGLIEWHPTCSGILFSAGYDCKILMWNLEEGVAVKMIDSHPDVVLCMSFNTDGSLLATSCKDKKLRIIDPRSGKVLQESCCKSLRVNRVVFLGNLRRVFTTGVSRWNSRQIALWDQDDLSCPLLEEEIDGLAGALFPYYDPDTHMLYLAGKGDGNIRYYEVGAEKPFLQFLTEFRSAAPQKSLCVMPKRGVDVSECEIFRFYKLVTFRGLVEPVSMIVPRRSEAYQEDIFPMTAGAESALSAAEWLSGIDRGPVLISLKEAYKRPNPVSLRASRRDRRMIKGIDLLENISMNTDRELLTTVYRQQEELRKLKEELREKEERIQTLELELNNLRNTHTH